MPTPKDRISALRAAYQWEQDRLLNWKNEVIAAVGGETNPMIKRFGGTWELYFDEVMASNQFIIDNLDRAIADEEDPETGVGPAIRRLNRVEHRKGSIASISNAVNAHRSQSPYFQSLDAVIDLENEVRDYIEDFLLNESGGHADAR